MSSNPQKSKKIGLNSVISWGASVVIVGLMFKILHLKGGEIMIAVGLLTESVLFAIMGFAAIGSDAAPADAHDDKKKDSGLDDLLATAISPAVIQKLSKGFEQFNKTVESVNAVANTGAIAQNMFKEIEAATGDIKKFRDNVSAIGTSFDAFGKTLQSINQMSVASSTMLKDFETASKGMQVYAKNMTEVNASFDTFSKTLQAINSMTVSSQSMLKEFEAATNGMKAYNKNITDLSKVYQAQLDAFRKN